MLKAKMYLVRLDGLVPREDTGCLRVKRLVRSIRELRAAHKPVILIFSTVSRPE